MKITQPNKHHKCWWLGERLRIVRIDLNYTEGEDWTKDIGLHWINGGGIRLILPSGMMWEITT